MKPHLTLLSGIAWHLSFTTTTTTRLQLFHFCSLLSHGISCWAHLVLKPLTAVETLLRLHHMGLLWNSKVHCDSQSTAGGAHEQTDRSKLACFSSLSTIYSSSFSICPVISVQKASLQPQRQTLHQALLVSKNATKTQLCMCDILVFFHQQLWDLQKSVYFEYCEPVLLNRHFKGFSRPVCTSTRPCLDNYWAKGSL